jgi:hypothetical protein
VGAPTEAHSNLVATDRDPRCGVDEIAEQVPGLGGPVTVADPSSQHAIETSAHQRQLDVADIVPPLLRGVDPRWIWRFGSSVKVRNLTSPTKGPRKKANRSAAADQLAQPCLAFEKRFSCSSNFGGRFVLSFMHIQRKTNLFLN